VKFSELFQTATSRSEVVVTFLALLELIRLKQLTAVQLRPFGEIEICRAALPPETTAAQNSASPEQKSPAAGVSGTATQDPSH
jgi:segregation and condensation protein A